MIAGDDCSLDAFLGGRVFVHQPRTGFRAGTDSVLISAAIEATAVGKALEFGCGAGGALLPAAVRAPGLTLTGLERDKAMSAMALRSVAHNGLGERVTILDGDVADLPPEFENQFDLVFSNPPFFPQGTIKQPAVGRENAYVESVPLKGWIDAMLFSLRYKGRFLMIHRAAELAKILALIERRTGAIEVMPVRSWPGADAKGGERTEIAQSITRDGVGLDWS